MRRSRDRLVIAFTVLVPLAGCADGPPYGDLYGHVTLDGRPLPERVVRLVEVDGKTATATALIADGKFHERVPVGQHRVEISAAKLPRGVASSKEMKRGTVDENVPLEELIPPRYNVRSTLTAEVRKGT